MNTKHKDTESIFRKELIQHLEAACAQGDLASALSDLLTPSELSEISKRLQIFKMLEAGIPQRQIAEQLGVGIATVTRGSRVLKEQT